MEKKWGQRAKMSFDFLDFSKKTTSQKTRFFQVGRNFGWMFENKPKIIDFLGPRPRHLENDF